MGKKILFVAGSALVLLVIASGFASNPGAYAQTATYDVTLTRTLLTMPGNGFFVNDDVPLIGARWLSGGYFAVSSYCSGRGDSNKKGLWVFDESGGVIGTRDTCLDVGENGNGSVSHTWGVVGNIQPTGANSFVKEMGPNNGRPPVYYTVSSGGVNYVSQAYPSPLTGSGGANLGSVWTDAIAAIPGYAVSLKNGRNILYGLPGWTVLQDIPAAFVPITGAGSYIIGAPTPGNGGLVVYRVTSNALEKVGTTVTEVRPLVSAVDVTNSNKIGFLFYDTAKRHHVSIYNVSSQGLTLDRDVVLSSSVTSEAVGPYGLAVSGDYISFVSCELPAMPLPPSGASDFFSTATCGLAVMKGSARLNVQRLPYATTIGGSASNAPVQTLPPAINTIAMSPNGTIIATSFYGVYMYKVGGVSGGGNGNGSGNGNGTGSGSDNLSGGPGTPLPPGGTNDLKTKIGVNSYTVNTLQQLLNTLQTLLGLRLSVGSGPGSSATPPPSGGGGPAPAPFDQGTGPCASGALKGNSPGTQTVAGEAIVNLVRMAINCPTNWVLKRPLDSYMVSGSPNQKLVSRVWYYAWAKKAGTAADQTAAKKSLLDAFTQQDNQGHYSIGANEAFPTSHYEVWYTGTAGARFFAWFYHDPELLAATAKWWRQEIALDKLLVRDNKILTPGTRFSPGQPTSSQLRDVLYYQLASKDLPVSAGGPGKPPGGPGVPDSPWWKDFYNSGPWIMRNLLRLGDDVGGAGRATNADLPTLHNPLCVYSKGSDYVFSFPVMTDALEPLYWTARINGVESHGPYSKSPAIPAPVLAGASLFVVPGPGGNVSGCTP